ncbi:MAG TPA: TIGR03013 family XrtA/PEP-CTERM system glycosyltransferase [Alphaproteobacteria bacterium]|nr:TIGR03013 family XrtA/PEP-CTERM system glycosyltransferase [Alphaproteobacteria bacterium]
MLRLFRHYLSVPAIALLLCDGFAAALMLFIGLRYLSPHAPAIGPGPYGSIRWSVDICAPVAILCVVMYSMGLYEKSSLIDFKKIPSRLIVGIIFCLPLLVVFAHFNFRAAVSLPALALHYAAWLAAIFAADLGIRAAYASIADSMLLQRRILVLGHGQLAARIEEFVRRQIGPPICIVGFIPVGEGAPAVSPHQILTATEGLRSIARRLHVHEMVIAVDDRRGFPVQQLLDIRLAGVQIIDYQSFWEREARKVYLDRLYPGWLVYSDGFQLSTVINGVLKRLLDVVVSLLFLLFILPIFVTSMIAIRLDSRGPIFYSQERVGRNGKVFTLYKFRTMTVDAEGDGTPRWASQGDQRITRVGSFLRKTRIDEIPQVINVLKGEMSFVGPRPERPYFVDNLTREIPYYTIRHLVRPGITGWAQVNYPYGSSLEDAKEKLAYELYYIKNYSFVFDLLIILMTVQVVLWNKGAR